MGIGGVMLMILFTLFVAAIVFFLIGKNWSTFVVRNHFVMDWDSYKKLPSYERMMFAYPLLWTRKQWRRWTERKSQ